MKLPRRAALVSLLAGLAGGRTEAAPPAAQPAPACAGEAQRIESLIEELSQLKQQLGEAEARLERLLRALSEQKGALANQPEFDALKQLSDGGADRPDPKPPVVRCAAITGSGNRCTRPAVPGSRYCRQHLLARQK